VLCSCDCEKSQCKLTKEGASCEKTFCKDGTGGIESVTATKILSLIAKQEFLRPQEGANHSIQPGPGSDRMERI